MKETKNKNQNIQDVFPDNKKIIPVNSIENSQEKESADPKIDQKYKDKIKEETKATIRCIPDHLEQTAGKCIYSDKETSHRVLFARAH